MLSSLPKLADRAFILGFFLPALLFTFAALGVLSDHEAVRTLLQNLAAKEPGDAAFVIVAIWIMSVLLLTLNQPLYRMFEGYSWPLSKLSRARSRYQKVLAAEQAKVKVLFEQWCREDDAFSKRDLGKYRELRLKLAKWSPTRAGDVMPTRFGNAIKAFEVYSRDLYGADGPPVWLRLTAVLPKGFLEQVQEARSQIDFLVNVSFYGFAIGVIGLADSLYEGGWIKVASVAAGLLVSRGAYLWATSCVPAWGELVMTAFDCYLGALAEKLGYELPDTDDKRREFWTQFSQAITYRRDPDGSLVFRPEDWPRAVAKKDSAKPNGDRGEDGGGADNDDHNPDD